MAKKNAPKVKNKEEIISNIKAEEESMEKIEPIEPIVIETPEIDITETNFEEKKDKEINEPLEIKEEAKKEEVKEKEQKKPNTFENVFGYFWNGWNL